MIPQRHLLQDWYWFAEDGRVYSSKRMAVVGQDDAGWLAAKAAKQASNWPRDESGNQTVAAMVAALAERDIGVDPKVHLYKHSADARWRMETRGVTVAGMSIPTDRESQALINGGVTFVQLHPSETVKWKTGNGTHVTLNATQVIAIGDAVAAHVQTAFAKEAEVSAQIASGAITTREQIEAAYVGA
jgi:hypothetical protein